MCVCAQMEGRGAHVSHAGVIESMAKAELHNPRAAILWGVQPGGLRAATIEPKH